MRALGDYLQVPVYLQLRNSEEPVTRPLYRVERWSENSKLGDCTPYVEGSWEYIMNLIVYLVQ